MIPEERFPISIQNEKLFKNTICDNFLSFDIPRKKFLTFHEKNKQFLYMDDVRKNLSFHSHFIHRTLAKIKKLHTQDIVKATSGFGFIFYCILSILIFITLLCLCFCPGVILSVVKCIVSNIVRFTTWICEYVCEGLHFVCTAVITAYRARRQEDNPVDDQSDNPIIRPFLPASLSFNEQPLTNQNEVEFCDPSTSAECPTVAVVSDTRPIQKVLRYKSGTFDMNPGVSVTARGASVRAEATAPLYPPVPRTPTFQRIFRD